MHRYCFILLSILVLGITSCKNKKPVTSSAKPKQDTTQTFPVVELLNADIDDVLKTPYFIYKKRTINKKLVDSSQLKVANFDSLILPIKMLDLNNVALKGKYKESAFHDLTTKSVTVVMSFSENSLSVQNITTLLNDETNKLKNVFIVFYKNFGDSTIRTDYNWKAGKSLQINKLTQYKKGKDREEKTYINWNENQ